MRALELVAENLEKSYGGRVVLKGFSARFCGGETACIMGPSGCGKTTLLRLLLGLEAPDAGTVAASPPGPFAAVFQEDRLCAPFSLRSNLRLVCPRATQEEMRYHLARVGLAGCEGQNVALLSGGMRRRAALVRAVLCGAPYLLLDEPFKGLDEGNRALAAAYVRECAAGRLTLVVTHDPEDAGRLGAGRVITLPPPGAG